VQKNETVLDDCIQILKRIAWKIQYNARKIKKAECELTEGAIVGRQYEDNHMDLFIEELLSNIPSDKGKQIVKKIVIDGYTEKEVASYMNMSQQGVNKCKVASLNQLRSNLKDYVY